MYNILGIPHELPVLCTKNPSQILGISMSSLPLRPEKNKKGWKQPLKNMSKYFGIPMFSLGGGASDFLDSTLTLNKHLSK